MRQFSVRSRKEVVSTLNACTPENTLPTSFLLVSGECTFWVDFSGIILVSVREIMW